MNFFTLEGGEPLKRMRGLWDKIIKKTARKIKKTKKTKTKVKTKSRLLAGTVNAMLALVLLTSTNPIIAVYAAELAPIAKAEPVEPEVQVDFSIIHIVNTSASEIVREKSIDKPKVATRPAIQKPAPTTLNLYPWSQCTWYVKSKRVDIPNRMGNASGWFRNANLRGFDTGSEARIGSIVVTREGPYGHVAYVEGFKNGNILISEMNFVRPHEGTGIISWRELNPNSSIIVGYIY